MKKALQSFLILLLAGCGLGVSGQTRVDLRNQSHLPGGASLPPACSPGEVFLKLQESVAILHTCQSPNTWWAVGAQPEGASGEFAFNNNGAFAGGNMAQAGDGSLSAKAGLAQRLCSPSPSPNPVLDASQCNIFALTLASALTEPSLVGAKAGQELIFIVTQGDTAGDLLWPANVAKACEVSRDAGVSTIVTAIYDGSAAIATGCVTNEAGTSLEGPTRAAPATPRIGELACWFDADAKIWKCKDATGAVSATVLAGTAQPNQYVTHIDGNGFARTAAISAAQLSDGTTGTGAVALAVGPQLRNVTLAGNTATDGVSVGSGCVSKTLAVGAAPVAANTLVRVYNGTAAPSDLTGGPVLGVAKIAGAAGATVEVCIAGAASLATESGAAVDHLVVPSKTAAGLGADSGQVAPAGIDTTVGIVGKVLSGCAGAGCLAIVNVDSPNRVGAAGAGGGGGGGTGNVVPPYLQSGASYYGPLTPMYPPNDPSFSWDNQGGCTKTVGSNGDVFLLCPRQASGNAQTSRILAAPAGNWTVDVEMVPLTANHFQYPGCFLGVFDATGSQRVVIQSFVDRSSNVNFLSFAVGYLANATTYSGDLWAITGGAPSIGNRLQFRIRKDTTLHFLYSADGFNYVEVATDGLTTHLPNGPGRLGWGVNPTSAASGPAIGCTLRSWRVY